MNEQELMISPKLDFIPDTTKIDGYKLQLSAITKVTNDDELYVAEGLVKGCKQYYKEVETLRKGFTVRLDNIKKEAMKYEKDLAEAFEPKEKLIAIYLREKELKRQAELKKIAEEQAVKAAALAEEQRKLAEFKENVLKFEISAKKAIGGCNTMEAVDMVEKNITEYAITEKNYGSHVAEAEAKRKELYELINQQRIAIASKKAAEVIIDTTEVEAQLEKTKVESVMTQAAEMQKLDLETQARTQTVSGVSGIRKVWTFEVDDLSKVPAELLLIDTTKVNALIKGGTREISGLRIFQDIARSGR